MRSVLKKKEVWISTQHKVSVVIRKDATEVERHGAKELRKYIGEILGFRSISLKEEGEKKNYGIELLVGRTCQGKSYLKKRGLNINKLEEDGFILVSGKTEKKKFVVLMGKRNRGTLYSIYAFLEKQGCRFFEPYDLGEVIPKRKKLVVDNLLERQNPTLPFRELDLDNTKEWNIIETIKILDWMVKNRLNIVTLVLFRNTFIQFLPALIKEIRKRDLTLGIGGPSIFSGLMLSEEFYKRKILPVEGRESRRDSFSRRYTKSSGKHGDPCLSNPEVVEQIKKNLIIFLEHHPEVKIVRFMCEDGFFGRTVKLHCNCEKCLKDGKVDASHFGDIYFEAVKSIAFEVEKQCPQVVIAYTYISTFGQPKIYSGDKRPSDMPENVRYFYICLEMEGYSYPLFSTKRPTLVLQTRQEKVHSDFVEWGLSQLKSTGRKLVLKEMHGSGLYDGVLRNTPHVIAENLRYLYNYSETYVGSMIFTNLLNQDHAMAWHSFGLNLYIYYRLVWHIGEDVDKLLNDFFKSYFAEGSKFMKQLYRIIEKKATHLIFKPYAEEIVPLDKDRGEEILQFYNKMLEEVDSGKELLDKAEVTVEAVKPAERLQRDRVQYRYLSSYLNFRMRYFRGEYFYGRSTRASSTREKKQLLDKSRKELKEARQILDILIETGISGYNGFHAFDVPIDNLIVDVERRLKVISLEDK